MAADALSRALPNSCDEEGKQLAGLLRDGAGFCRVHLDIFCANALAVPDPEPPFLFFIDFETTGLSVANDQIVKFGVVSVHGAVFLRWSDRRRRAIQLRPWSTGFQNDEIHNGPSFCVAFATTPWNWQREEPITTKTP